MTENEVVVVVTHHAAQRCRDRAVSIETMKREVRAAAVSGRKAKSKPRWCWLPDHDASKGAGARKDGTYRYLWTEGQERAYLCAKTATGWRVLTVLVNYEAAVA